tara:strand:+ start:25 stop:408 length:384 start_codon:yes stop_codon:yes gene_type:complete
MNRFLILSSLAIALIGTTSPAKAVPQKRNFIYTQRYDYPFKNQSTVAGCITRASAALANNGLGNEINSQIDDDNQRGIVYGWSRNRTETAEIECDRNEKTSFLSYAAFTDDSDFIWKKWTLLKDSDW